MDTEKLWTAVLERDAALNGQFFFGVLTTGVFCKPSCPARHPLRKNVRFYLTPEEAEKDGLRPCKRCKPLDAADRMKEISAYLREHCEEAVSLDDLSRVFGLSPYHLQRRFKEEVGVSPKQFQDACRMDRFKQHLKNGKDVTEAIYEAGYGSSSRLYERSAASLGMTPAAYRKGAPDVCIGFTIAPTAIGLMLVAATDRGLCRVEFGETRESLEASLRREYPLATLRSDAVLGEWVSALQRHLDRLQPELTLPLDVQISAFQARVYEELRAIPYGETRSYGDVAAAMGRPSAVRAVARACATNPVAIAVPCHRVVRSNGDLGGYRWGVERKRALLDAEKAQTR